MTRDRVDTICALVQEILRQLPRIKDSDDVPDIWLEGIEDEDERITPCGCKLIRNHQESGDPAFFYCDAHRTALLK
jgi:hypothetical protein